MEASKSSYHLNDQRTTSGSETFGSEHAQVRDVRRIGGGRGLRGGAGKILFGRGSSTQHAMYHLLFYVAQIPYIGIFLLLLYYSREARSKKIEEAFFGKKDTERGHILRLAYVFECYKLALLFEEMLDYITIFCIEVPRIH